MPEGMEADDETILVGEETPVFSKKHHDSFCSQK